MKTGSWVTIFSLLLVAAFAQESQAGVAFKCIGDKSRYETIEGFYGGEHSEKLMLNRSQVYSVINKLEKGYLTLSRLRVGSKVGILKNFPLQYSVTQRDDLGSLTTRFSIQLGVFGGSIGQRFQAVLSTNRTYVLDCEVVHAIDLR